MIALRGMTSENAFYKPPFYYPKEIAALSTVKGKVILCTSWEFDTLPASVSGLIPRADILVVLSQFMTELFPDSDCRVIRPPVKDLPYKAKSGRTYRIGGLIHPARRRNLQAWVELRSILPRKYRIVCVCAPEIKFDKEAELLLEKAADEWLFDLDDSQLAEFYHSLDWFVSFQQEKDMACLSEKRCVVEHQCSFRSTLAMKNFQVYPELCLFQQFGKLA